MNKKKLSPEKGPRKMKLYDESLDKKKYGGSSYNKPVKRGAKRMK
jgi:hypothetical protein